MACGCGSKRHCGSQCNGWSVLLSTNPNVMKTIELFEILCAIVLEGVSRGIMAKPNILVSGILISVHTHLNDSSTAGGVGGVHMLFTHKYMHVQSWVCAGDSYVCDCGLVDWPQHSPTDGHWRYSHHRGRILRSRLFRSFRNLLSPQEFRPTLTRTQQRHLNQCHQCFFTSHCQVFLPLSKMADELSNKIQDMEDELDSKESTWLYHLK